MRVLYVDIDSLRPDHLGCYGYERDTSPTIDRIAEDGVVFDRCYVSDSPCGPSRTALATARHGINNGVVTHYGSGQWYDEPGEGSGGGDPDRPLSFLHLSNGGVHTASVSSFSKRHLAYHFEGAFRESIQPTREIGAETVPEVTDAATDWLDTHATEDDWLLHVNYWDVHHPYEDIERELSAVRGSGPAPSFPTDDDIAAHREGTGFRAAPLWPSPSEHGDYNEERYADYPFPESVAGRADAERLVDGYDAAVRKVDQAVEALLDRLEAHGVREETAVVVTADHGEALGEHGVYTEHAFPHPPCQQVPLVVSWPGMASGEHVTEQVYQFDLMATLADLFRLDVPDGWDAEPFTPALRGDAFEGRDRIVAGHGIMTFGRAVYEGEWVYIRILHPGVFSVPGLYNDPDLPGDGLELLHHRGEDPHMRENLTGERPEKAAELRAHLDAFVADHGDGEDPLARMAETDGPYLYADPRNLIDLYEDLDRSEKQVAALRRSFREFPSAGVPRRHGY
jgi:arylsulfatase A-like enzyme